MSFSKFFNESMAMEEAAGFNFGDAMEGIFAIAVALYIADGVVDKNKLNAFRKQVIVSPKEPFVQMVDSNIAQDGWIASKLPHIQPGNKLAVKVAISLKNTAKDAFGPKAKPIPDIDTTIEQMTTQIVHTSAVKKIQQFIIKVLTNNKPDDITFYVVADGSENVSSGEQIKGDVMLRVEAKTNTSVPKDVEQPVRFSIKTDTSTTSKLSIFTAILRLGNFFGLPLTKGLEGLQSFPTVGGSRSSNVRNMIDGQFSQQAKDPNHLLYYVRNFLNVQDKVYSAKDNDSAHLAYQKVQEYAWIIIDKAIAILEDQLQKKDAAYDFNARTFNFLEKEIFGSDMAEVIRLVPGSISEISRDTFDIIKNQYDVEYASVGKDMKFIGVNKETGKRDLLFTLKPEIRMTPKEKVMRFDVILGPIFYKSVEKSQAL